MFSIVVNRHAKQERAVVSPGSIITTAFSTAIASPQPGANEPTLCAIPSVPSTQSLLTPPRTTCLIGTYLPWRKGRTRVKQEHARIHRHVRAGLLACVQTWRFGLRVEEIGDVRWRTLRSN